MQSHRNSSCLWCLHTPLHPDSLHLPSGKYEIPLTLYDRDLTADGQLRPCLGHHGEYQLKPALRPLPDKAELLSLLDKALAEKPPEHEFRNNWQPHRIMTAIGG